MPRAGTSSPLAPSRRVHTAGVVSHQSAALILGLPTPGFGRWEDQPVSLTLPVTGHSASSATVIHHKGPLPGGQVQRDRDGYLVTTPARTAVDLAADLPLPEALVLLDSAARLICASLVTQIHRRDYANPQLLHAAVDLLERAATTVRATRLRPALALVNPSRESAAESLSAGHMQLAGIPTPISQAEIRTPIGKVYPDLLWEDLKNRACGRYEEGLLAPSGLDGNCGRSEARSHPENDHNSRPTGEPSSDPRPGDHKPG